MKVMVRGLVHGISIRGRGRDGERQAQDEELANHGDLQPAVKVTDDLM